MKLYCSPSANVVFFIVTVLIVDANDVHPLTVQFSITIFPPVLPSKLIPYVTPVIVLFLNVTVPVVYD